MRTITTAKELDALPLYSVIIPVAPAKQIAWQVLEPETDGTEARYCSTDADYKYQSKTMIALHKKFVVLYEGDAL